MGDAAFGKGSRATDCDRHRSSRPVPGPAQQGPRKEEMKLLHTSDWHVGKTIKGNSRIEEHRAVLAEIVDIAKEEEVDVVLVVGDLFESAAPTPEAQSVVWDTLLALRN